MTITEIRQKYPQYNDLSDTELADSLHQKFYSDMPKEEYYSKIGITSPKSSTLPKKDYLLESAKELGEQTSNLEKFRIGMGKGFVDVGSGIKQILLEAGKSLGKVSPEEISEFHKKKKRESEVYKSFVGESGWAKAGEFVGQVAPMLPIPGGVAGGMAKRAATSGLAGGLISGVQYTPEEESRLTNIGTGIAAGAAGSGVLSVLGKGINIAKGKINPKFEKIEKLSKEFGVPITYGEAAGSPALKMVETLLEAAPFVGTAGISGGFRKRQLIAAESAAKTMKEKYGSRITGDTGETIVNSLLKTLEKNKNIVNESYDKVSKASVGASKIAPIETKKTVGNLLSEYPDLFQRLRDQKLENRLLAITQNIPSNRQMGLMGKINFDDMRGLQKSINNLIGRAKQSAGAVGNEELRALSMVHSAIEKDLDNWALNSSDKVVRELYSKAKDDYMDLIVPFKDSLIKKVTGEGYDTDLIFQNFIKPERAKLAGKLVSQLDLEGENAVKYAIISNAFRKASPETTGKEIFSPQTFATQIKKLSTTNRVIFKPDELRELNGLAKILETAKRGGQYLENPPTGYRAAQLATFGLLGGIAVADPSKMGDEAKMLTGIALVTGLLTTKAGKRVLMSASKMESRSPTINKMLQQFYNQLPKIPVNLQEVEN